MKKIIMNGILSLSIFLTAPDSAFSSDLEKEILENSRRLVNNCINHCNAYYKENRELQDFKHFDIKDTDRAKAAAASGSVRNYLGKLFSDLETWVVGSGPEPEPKSALCRGLEAAMAERYANESTVWNACKRGAKCVAQRITNNQKIIGTLSSCKDICADEIGKICKW